MAGLLRAPVTSIGLLLSVDHARAPFRCNRETSRNCGRLSRVRNSLCVKCQKSSDKVVTNSERSKKRNDEGEGWILDNAGVVRSGPLFVGGTSLAAVLLNRSFSGIAAVADASRLDSAQSRADVLAVALSAVVVLTGLVWKSIEPRPQFPVDLDGVECFRVAPGLPVEAARELKWAWDALAQAANTAALVVVYGKTCVLQCGTSAQSSDGIPVPVDVVTLLQGSLCKTVRTSNTQMYLANLALYPGRFELPFLPSNTQAVIIQPVGNDGIMIVASDTLRGFGPSDQGWIVAIGEKLDSTLADTMSVWDRGLVSSWSSSPSSSSSVSSQLAPIDAGRFLHASSRVSFASRAFQYRIGTHELRRTRRCALSDESSNDGVFVPDLQVPKAWVAPEAAVQEAEWLRGALHQWLDDEFCPEPANEEISKRCAKVYYYCLLEEQLDIGDILMQMVRDLETFSFKQSFHGAFSSANAAIDLITKRMRAREQASSN